MTESAPSITIVLDNTPRDLAEAAAVLAQISPTRAARAARYNNGLFGWLLFIGLSIALIFLLNMNPKSAPSGASDTSRFSDLPSDAYLSLFILALGSVLFVGSLIMGSLARRARLLRWRGEILFTFNTDGITQQRPGRRDTWHWSRFLGLDETPNLFVVRDAPRHGFVFPKRLFPNPSDLQMVSQLLRDNLIRPAIPLTKGFPVTLR